MKVRFLKNVVVDVEKRSGEIFDKSINRWSELMVEQIFLCGDKATFQTYDGDYILLIPKDSFEKLPEKRGLTID